MLAAGHPTQKTPMPKSSEFADDPEGYYEHLDWRKRTDAEEDIERHDRENPHVPYGGATFSYIPRD